MENKYDIIITILNRGFSDLVMDSARSEGATGGTIITARGTAPKEVEKRFGLTISLEKEIILILTPKENKNRIMTAICKATGLNTQGKGITFSLPVDDVLGITPGITLTPPKKPKKKEEKVDIPLVSDIQNQKDKEE